MSPSEPSRPSSRVVLASAVPRYVEALAMDDVARLRASLGVIEDNARSLPWANERAWRTASHVGQQGKRPLIDLHDLSVRLALDVVASLEREAPDLESGCVILITGRGRHTGGRSVLRDAVMKQLISNQDRLGWQMISEGPGRLRVELDEARARASAPGLGALFWGFVLLLIGAIAAIAIYR